MRFVRTEQVKFIYRTARLWICQQLTCCWIEGTIYGQWSTCRCRSGRHWQETRSISAVKTGLGECPKKKGSPENKNLDRDNTIQSVGRSLPKTIIPMTTILRVP
jgi:hypothetical protein